MPLLLDLFLTFSLVGISTFGGGYAMLPVLQREVVTSKAWISDAELTDCFAIGQCTPGTIAVNVSTFVGFRQKGILGGVVATLGMVFPSLLIICLIAAFLDQFTHIPWVMHAFSGIRACVCALVFSSVWKLFQSAVVDAPAAIIFCVALAASARFGFSPALVVLLGGILGLTVRLSRRLTQ